MALVLKRIFSSGSDEITQNYAIESWHVSQSVDALTGAAAYDITVSGSLTLTGSVNSLNGYTGSLLGNVIGTADSASKANQIVVSSSITSTNQFLVPFVADSTSGYPKYSTLLVDSGSDYSGLWYQPSTNALSASLFIGDLTGTASLATDVINVPDAPAVQGTYYPSGSAQVPNSSLKFIAGAGKTEAAPSDPTASITIADINGKTLGQNCFVTATVSGSLGAGNGIVVNSLVGSDLTFQAQQNETDFYYTIVYI